MCTFFESMKEEARQEGIEHGIECGIEHGIIGLTIKKNSQKSVGDGNSRYVRNGY